MIFQHAILMPRPWLGSTEEPFFHLIDFMPLSPHSYRCMDCAKSNLEWAGTEEEAREHADLHARMAQWFHHTFLPGYRSSMKPETPQE